MQPVMKPALAPAPQRRIASSCAQPAAASLPVASQQQPSRRTALLLIPGAALAYALLGRRAAPAPEARPAVSLPVSAADIEVRRTNAGDTRYYAVTIFDDYDEDGDVVAVSIPGQGSLAPFVLTNRGDRILIPAASGSPVRFLVTAVRDGMGVNQVSFGASTSAGSWTSAILPEGAVQEFILQP